MGLYDSDSSTEWPDVIETEDGRLLCRHGQVTCPRCCVDYSFMDEIMEDSDAANERAEREADELYWQLSEESRAQIDARWGPPPPRSHPGAPRAASRLISPDDHENSLAEIDPFPAQTSMVDTPRRGTGRIFPAKFVVPSLTATPASLFPCQTGHEAAPPVRRYIRRDNPRQILIYTDGACLDNGQPGARAGFAFVFKPATEDSPLSGVVACRLENKGPFGDESVQTSNRAELRAVIAALRFRYWRGEGFTSLVVATDSEYVAEGATTWVRSWVRNGWKTSAGREVKNRDLWEAFLGEMERWDDRGLEVQFWRIPRQLNQRADQAAKRSAETPDTSNYRDISGVLV